ncbi:MAG: carboxymuconolactone decarboxylase family protein [Acidimicrobiales bacterium]
MAQSRPTEPRIPLLSNIDPESEAGQVLGGAISLDGEPLNIFRALANHPKLFKRFNLMGGFLLNKGLIPEREREIVILRVGWRAKAVYEFGQHTVIGRRCGLSDEEIAALASDETTHQWSDADADLIALADELCADDCVSDATFARLSERWNEAELIELVVCAGFYRLVSGFLNTMGIPLDDTVPGWP